jgi:hypothetical protein
VFPRPTGHRHWMDMNAYLDFRRDKAHLKYGLAAHGPSTAVMDPLQRPRKRSRDGSTSVANVLTKLKLLHDKWYFDLTVDNWVVPDARLEGHGHIKSSSPCPSLFIMCGLQRAGGAPHVPPAVSHVTRSCCVMTFVSLRETKLTGSGSCACLPTIIHDNIAWFEVGGRSSL